MSEVIARLREQGDVGNAWYEEYREPKPLESAPPTLPNGDALPSELAEWLKYDATWLPLLDENGLRAASVRDILGGWIDEMEQDEDGAEELEELEDIVGEDALEYWIKGLPEPPLADVHAIELPPSGKQDHLLMLEPGRSSLRVLGFHKRLEFFWKYDSFTAFVAHYFGFEEPPVETT